MDYRRFLVPGIAATTGAAWVCLSTLEENLISRRQGLIGLAAFFLIFSLARWALSFRLKTSSDSQLPRRYIAAAFMLAILLSIPTPGSLSFLQIRSVTIEALASSGPVVFEGLNNGHIDIPHTLFANQGGWQYAGNRFTAQTRAVLQWSGRVSNQPTLTFQSGPGMGSVRIAWDKEVEKYILSADASGQVILRTILPVSAWPKWIYRVVSLALFTALLYLLLGWIISLPRPLPGTQHRRGFWLKFAVPILIPCLVTLLVYFPGLMSGDSLVQWVQAHDLQFNDHHPVFHTLFIWLATRAWDSPAAAAAAQILALSVTAAWGIGNMVKRGKPEAAGWLISLIFALSPVNWLYAATIWKDIPYGISLLWLTLIFVEIFFTQGRWLADYKNLAAISVCALFVSLFRHNGFPVAVILLLVTMLVYRKQKKWSFAALVLVLTLRGLITGPGYSALGAYPVPANLKYSLILYHIGAHVDSGTPISSQDREAIEALMPLTDWEYSPCSASPIILSKKLNREPLERDPAKYARLVFNLFLQDPAPDVRAALDLGALVYSIDRICDPFITPLSYKPGSSTGATWIDFTVDTVGGENSKLPKLVAPLSKFYDRTTSYDSFKLLNILFWRPAASLIAALAAAFASAWLKRNWNLLFVALPALVQSAVLLLVNLAQEPRYQYGVYLAALFFTGFLLFTIWEFENDRLSRTTGD